MVNVDGGRAHCFRTWTRATPTSRRSRGCCPSARASMPACGCGGRVQKTVPHLQQYSVANSEHSVGAEATKPQLEMQSASRGAPDALSCGRHDAARSHADEVLTVLQGRPALQHAAGRADHHRGHPSRGRRGRVAPRLRRRRPRARGASTVHMSAVLGTHPLLVLPQSAVCSHVDTMIMNVFSDDSPRMSSRGQLCPPWPADPEP